MGKNTGAIMKGAPVNFFIGGRDAGYGEAAALTYKPLYEKVKLGSPKNLICKLPEELESGIKLTLLQIDPTNISDALSGAPITEGVEFSTLGITHLSTLNGKTGTMLGIGTSYEQKEPSVTIQGVFPMTNLAYTIHYWKANLELAGDLNFSDERAKLEINVESLRSEDKSPNYHGVWWFEDAT